jgi:hypothetical protein
MNWFERYGIVGACFLFFVILWFTSIHPVLLTDSQVKFVGWLFLFIFLPIGYGISIISQSLYYLGLSGHRIHKEFIEELKDEVREKHNLEKTYCDEAKSESILTCRIRLDEKNDLKRIQYLASYVTKRFDVIAINKSIILSTFLSLVVAVITCLFIFKGWNGFEISNIRLLLVIGVLLVFNILLMINNSKMYTQIEIIIKEILNKMWEPKKDKSAQIP